MFFKKSGETDDEFVAKIRKRVNSGRKHAIGLFVCSFIFIILSFVLLQFFFKLVISFSIDLNVALIGIVAGMIFGFVITLLIALSVNYFRLGFWFFVDQREYKLLIKYYDQLNPSVENNN